MSRFLQFHFSFHLEYMIYPLDENSRAKKKTNILYKVGFIKSRTKIKSKYLGNFFYERDIFWTRNFLRFLDFSDIFNIFQNFADFVNLFESSATKFPEKIVSITWLQMYTQNDFLQFVSVCRQNFV